MVSENCEDLRAPFHFRFELHKEGKQFREIGVRLATDRFMPPQGGIWHPGQVHALLASGQPQPDA